MKFKIITNPQKEWAKKLQTEVESLLRSRKQQLVSFGEDVTLMIGGDGTIFYAKDQAQGAIFAIGGTQSKVCQASNKNWKPALEKILKIRKLEVEERTALSVKINGNEAGWAINDAVVHSRRHNFVFISVKFGRDEHRFGGDGIIVATPTGASGYAYSAGGFVLDRANFMVELVPICPYLRAFRPQIVPVASEITITGEGASDLILDGQKIIELGEKDVVTVIGDRTVDFVDV